MFAQKFRFSPVHITMYLLILICVVGDTKEEAQSVIFTKLQAYRINNIYKTVSSLTEVQCCAQCLEDDGCVSINVRTNSSNQNCNLNSVSPLDANVSIEKSANSSVFYKDNAPWKLVFRLTSGGGTDPYQAYVNGVGTANSDDCMMLYPPMCTRYYRHERLDDWKQWNVYQVRFALYYNRTEVAYVIFNGTGSDKESWFSKERVLESSWTDLMGTSQLIYFSIKGDYNLGRHFFIHEYYGGCPADRGWTATVSGKSYCSFDIHPSYPGIVYARNQTKSTYNSTGFGIADVLGVYIKLK
ncbi:hypothetical protein ACJMK2_035768 [Sinanodonta woodiana]|uniref:Apple domain-containing protein n=1 Tax=Sinanodonta woodiana TaxID=1069815 RepID=A0ABD3WJ66_SINWO